MTIDDDGPQSGEQLSKKRPRVMTDVAGPRAPSLLLLPEGCLAQVVAFLRSVEVPSFALTSKQRAGGVPRVTRAVFDGLVAWKGWREP